MTEHVRKIENDRDLKVAQEYLEVLNRTLLSNMLQDDVRAEVATTVGELQQAIADYHKKPSETPRCFRYPTGGEHRTGRKIPWAYGVYFPMTDLCVTDMGERGTGMPGGDVDWLDSI